MSKIETFTANDEETFDEAPLVRVFQRDAAVQEAFKSYAGVWFLKYTGSTIGGGGALVGAIYSGVSRNIEGAHSSLSIGLVTILYAVAMQLIQDRCKQTVERVKEPDPGTARGLQEIFD